MARLNVTIFTIVIVGYPISTHIWQLSTTGKSITTSAKLLLQLQVSGTHKEAGHCRRISNRSGLARRVRIFLPHLDLYTEAIFPSG